MIFRIGSWIVSISFPARSLALLSFLVALVVVTYLLMLVSRRKRVSYFGNFETLKKVHGVKRFYLNPTILLVKLVVVVLLFLLATDSITVSSQRQVTDTDFVIALDSSPSMSIPDYTPTRFEMAKKVASQWLSLLPNGTIVGFLSFSDSINSYVEPTPHMDVVADAIKKASISYSSGGTSVDYALQFASDLFNQSAKKKVVLLITDGSDSVSNNTLVSLKSKGVIVHSIGLANNEKTALFFANLQSKQKSFNFSIPGESNVSLFEMPELNVSILEEISNSTGGKVFEVSNPDELNSVLRSISLETVSVNFDSDYYVTLLVAILSILEFVIYAKLGAL